eukprot:Platyproteum_vivax@DN13215_c0_g1_i1.p1
MEIDRILAARHAYQVFDLPIEIVDSTVLRSKFKKLAVQIHPDKSTDARATECFRKLFASLQELLDFQIQKELIFTLTRKKAKVPVERRKDVPKTTGDFVRWWEKSSIYEMEEAFQRMEAQFQDELKAEKEAEALKKEKKRQQKEQREQKEREDVKSRFPDYDSEEFEEMRQEFCEQFQHRVASWQTFKNASRIKRTSAVPCPKPPSVRPSMSYQYGIDPPSASASTPFEVSISSTPTNLLDLQKQAVPPDNNDNKDFSQLGTISFSFKKETLQKRDKRLGTHSQKKAEPVDEDYCNLATNEKLGNFNEKVQFCAPNKDEKLAETFKPMGSVDAKETNSSLELSSYKIDEDFEDIDFDDQVWNCQNQDEDDSFEPKTDDATPSSPNNKKEDARKKRKKDILNSAQTRFLAACSPNSK